MKMLNLDYLHQWLRNRDGRRSFGGWPAAGPPLFSSMNLIAHLYCVIMVVALEKPCSPDVTCQASGSRSPLGF